MDLEFINIAKILKKVYPGTLLCTCYKCQDAKGAKNIMKASENRGPSAYILDKKHMKCMYKLSKQRYEKKPKQEEKRLCSTSVFSH